MRIEKDFRTCPPFTYSWSIDPMGSGNMEKVRKNWLAYLRNQHESYSLASPIKFQYKGELSTSRTKRRQSFAMRTSFETPSASSRNMMFFLHSRLHSYRCRCQTL
jgi:hypothetical protein